MEKADMPIIFLFFLLFFLAIIDKIKDKVIKAFFNMRRDDFFF